MSDDFKEVWVMRNPTGHVHVITEMDPTGGDPLAFGWTITRETLLTPEMAAVIAAAKLVVERWEFAMGRSSYPPLPEVEAQLITAVTTLRAQEGT